MNSTYINIWFVFWERARNYSCFLEDFILPIIAPIKKKITPIIIVQTIKLLILLSIPIVRTYKRTDNIAIKRPERHEAKHS